MVILVKPISGGYTRRKLTVEGDVVVVREAKVANPSDEPTSAKTKEQHFPPKVMDLMSAEEYLGHLAQRYLREGFEFFKDSSGPGTQRVWYATKDIPLDRVNDLAARFGLPLIEGHESVNWTLGGASITVKRTGSSVKLSGMANQASSTLVTAFMASLACNVMAVIGDEAIAAKALALKELERGAYSGAVLDALRDAGMMGPKFKPQFFARKSVLPPAPLASGL